MSDPLPATHYRIQPISLERHRWHVEMTIARPTAPQTVALPVWIPGSYLVREFARHLDHLTARQNGQPCKVNQQDKCSWSIDCQTNEPLVLSYEIYALDNSVRASWLDDQRGFFNGTSVFLRNPENADTEHQVTVEVPPSAPHWKLATAMTPVQVDARGFGTYQAADYDELVDSPVEMGDFWSGEFEAAGIRHRFVVAGAPASFDGARLLADARTICETAIALWQDDTPPSPQGYVFMLNAVGKGYGGLEHRASTALICARADLPRKNAPADATCVGDGYVTLLGLISHEYFHRWNVKRLKPAEFAPFDYGRENHTELLWFFEGFTSYYDDLLLVRAGLISEARYLQLFTRTVNQVQQAPGEHVQSVAQASFDAWTRYYRPEANTPNTTISYYSKGALVALCLDLTLRQENHATLDDAMRALWKRCQGGPVRESDIAAALAEVGGRSFEHELAAWVHGTDELPLQELLQAHDIQMLEDAAPPAQALGLRVDEGDGGITLRVVLDGGPAAQAAMAPGDEWLGIEVPPPASNGTASPTAWRLKHLSEIDLFAGTAQRVTALIARDQRLLRLPLTLPQASKTWRLKMAKALDAQNAWPHAKPKRPS